MRPRVEGSRIGETAEGAGEDDQNHNDIDCEGVAERKKKVGKKNMGSVNKEKSKRDMI